jgi:hypothetical protein
MTLDHFKDSDTKESNGGAKDHVPQRQRNRKGKPRVCQHPFVEHDDRDGYTHPHEHVGVGLDHLLHDLQEFEFVSTTARLS